MMRTRMAAILLLALGLAGCGGGGGSSSNGAAAGSAGKLDQATVKQVVDASYGPGQPGTLVVNEWNKIAIAPARAASAAEAAAAAIPPGTEIVPVEVRYNRTQTTGSSHIARDLDQNYLFYRDKSGSWAAAATAQAGNEFRN